jgi:hypothetical protein
MSLLSFLKREPFLQVYNFFVVPQALMRLKDRLQDRHGLVSEQAGIRATVT